MGLMVGLDVVGGFGGVKQVVDLDVVGQVVARLVARL